MNDPRPAENTPATGGDFAHAGRRIEIAVEVPGTPEEVWDAVATGPGISSWFIPMEVEERTGGEVVMDWGSFGRETAEVAVWDPPHRVVFRGPDEGALAFEWLVEAQGGGSCVVRLVNSGFGEGDEWDGQFHGMAEGWKIFLEHLRLQRTHFPGARARAAIPTVMAAGPRAEAWATFCGHLGIPADAAPGDQVVTSGDAPELRARVETVLRTDAAVAYLLLVEHPAPGTAFLTVEGDGDRVAASTYLYLYDGAGGPPTLPSARPGSTGSPPPTPATSPPNSSPESPEGTPVLAGRAERVSPGPRRRPIEGCSVCPARSGGQGVGDGSKRTPSRSIVEIHLPSRLMAFARYQVSGSSVASSVRKL